MSIFIDVGCTEYHKCSSTTTSTVIFRGGSRKFVILEKFYNIRAPEYHITGQSDNLSIGFYVYSFKLINIFAFHISEIKF